METPTDELVPTNPPRRGRRWLLGGTTLVAVSVAVVGGMYLFRDRPEARSVDAAVERFRSSTTLTPGTTVPFDRPVVGVYEAEGSGRESLSVPPNSQADGDVLKGRSEMALSVAEDPTKLPGVLENMGKQFIA